MKKQLVQAGDIESHLSHDGKTFHANGNMILTPGAKDALHAKGITIVHDCESHNEECSKDSSLGGQEDLLIAVAALLKNEFGINDPETLKLATCMAVKTIRENI